MDMRALLQQYIKFSHDTLEATLGELTADQARELTNTYLVVHPGSSL
jgi:hypothetical protein